MAFDPRQLTQLAAEHGTPLWVYDAAVIRERIAQLRRFDTIRYAQKACSNLHILRLMRAEGVMVDAVSLGEIERSLAAFTAWQAEAMRRAVGLNREGDRRGAKHFLERELRWLERYARGLPGTEPLLAELVLLLRRAEEDLDPRLREELYAASMMRARHEKDLRSAPRAPLADMLRREPRR